MRHLPRVSRLSRISLALITTLVLAACGENRSTTTTDSNVLVSDVHHSEVKRQSIGNCWLYATASWLESLALDATGQTIDTSESYWTWWYFHDQIVGSRISEIQTGGWWGTAASIILRHGYVLEGEFVTTEAGVEMWARNHALSHTSINN